MSNSTDSRPSLDRAFERKVRRSKWALLFEQLWPRLWLIVGVAALFLLVSLLGVWPLLPKTMHLALLGAFGLAFLAAFVFALRLRWPSRDEAIRRIERVSGIAHRPASSYEDTITAGADDPRTKAIWQAHKQRLADLLSRLRVGKPHPRTDRLDPVALRALLLLGVIALGALVGDSAADRIRSAFRFDATSILANARLDAWVTPPGYTGRPPVMLADGSRSGATPAASGKLVQVPSRSVLIVRATGAGLTNLGLDVLEEGAEGPKQVKAKIAAAGETDGSASDVSELRFELTKPARVRVFASGGELASWTFDVTPDNPPKIALTKEPARTRRGAMRLNYSIEDDYGVASAEVKLKRVEKEEPADSSNAWARANVLKGPRPPYERPPALPLRLPQGGSNEAQTYIDFGPHPWAGREVVLTLEATDIAGNIGRSKQIRMFLPKRQFQNPLARAVVEQRSKLLDDPRYRDQVVRALEALTLEPEGFIDDSSVYLGLRTAYRSLKRDDSRAGRKSVTDGLWELALQIEDGDLSEAERALRDAQDKLADALERGAPDAELQKLMQELRAALKEYMEQLNKNIAKDQMNPPEGLNSQDQQLSQQDLDRMMEELEQMTRNGSREQAQKMLAELRDLLERLQTGQMTKSEAQRGQMMMKKLDELGDIVGQQQRLMDETYRENRRQGQRSPGGQGQQDQQGQRGQQGQPQQGQRGQPGQAGQQGQAGLDEQQRALREQLEQLRRSLDELGADSPELEGAREAMKNAEEALGEGDTGQALRDQSDALQQLREGAQDMAEGMQQGGASPYGQAGNEQRDPLGRPQRFQGPDSGNSVKVPDEIDMQRARAILEELRRRLAEPARPPAEIDYFERLLRRF